MSKLLDLEALRREASKPDEEGDVIVTRNWLRQALREMEFGRAAELELLALRDPLLVVEPIGPGATA